MHEFDNQRRSTIRRPSDGRLGRSTEFEFLVNCCSAVLRNTSPEIDREPKSHGTLDWQAVVDLATNHEVIPTLDAFARRFPEQVPKEVVRVLGVRCVQRTRRNAQLARALARHAATLDEAAVRYLSFKGPTLAVTSFGDILSREYRDIDLLVDPEDFFPAVRCLATRGNCSLELDPRNGRNVDLECLSSLNHLREVSLRDEMGTAIDLHQGLVRKRWSCELSFPALWAHRVSVQLIDDASVCAPSPEDLIVMLCIQAGYDAAEGRLSLKKLLDIAAMFEAHPTIALDEACVRARRARCEGIVAFGLHLTARTFQLPCNRGLHDSQPRTLRRVAQAQVELEGVYTSRGLLEREAFFAALRETPKDLVVPMLRWAVTATAEDGRLYARGSVPYRILACSLRPIYLLVSRLRMALAHALSGRLTGPTTNRIQRLAHNVASFTMNLRSRRGDWTNAASRGRTPVVPAAVARLDEIYVPLPGVEAVELDGRLVLLDDDSDDVFDLDPIASVLWNCIDGTSTLEEIAFDLAVEMPDCGRSIGEDIRRFANQLTALGLIEASSPSVR